MSLSPATEPLILAIDTSCDDTSAAVTSGWQVWSNVIASQTELHKPFGGVFPTVAKQAHLENIEPAVKLALRRAGVTTPSQLSAVAVTIGPGLAPSLEIGINFAKEFAIKHKLPLIPINHMEGHLLSAWATPKPRRTKSSSPARLIATPAFPALGVLISGGHSEFILVKNFGDYTKLGQTIDDAAGEALDKVGRMLDLGYPAGPVIEQFAKLGNPHRFEFPLPMTTTRDFNVSFSGLKTYSRNLLRQLESEGELEKKQAIFDFAASFQFAVFRHLIYKLKKILIDYPEIQQIWLGGGVAANMTLRATLRAAIRPLPLYSPYTKRLCQDNAAMIGTAAYAGAFLGQYNVPIQTPNAIELIDRQPRLELE